MTTTFGEICEIQLGKMLSPKAHAGGKRAPYLRNQNVQWGRFKLDDVVEMDFDDRERAKFSLRPGDLLVCEGGEPGRAAIWEGQIQECFYQKALFRLRPHSDKTTPEFLLYRLWLGGIRKEFAESQGRTTIAHLPAERLAKVPVGLPDLPTQRRITSLLDDQLALVALVRRQVEEQLLDAESLRLKYFRDAFESDALAACKVRPLLDCARIASGMTLGGATAKAPTTKVPYLRVANVKDGWLMLDDVKEIEATERDIEQFQLRYGDVVLTEGGDPDKLGRGTVWREEIDLCLHQNHIFRVRFDRDQVCSEFAAYQFASHYGKAYFLAHAKQTTGIASINKGVLSRFPFRLPPLLTQRRISARLREQFEHLQQLKSALSEQLEALDRLPGAYLREAFGNLS